MRPRSSANRTTSGITPHYWERFGFSVRHEWTSIEITGRAALRSMLSKVEHTYRQMIEQGYQFRPMDPGDSRDIRRLHYAETRSFERFLGYTPFALEEFERLITGYMRLVDHRFVTLVHDRQGQVVGFSVAYPDIAEALRAMGGKNTSLAKLQFLFQRRRANRVVHYMMGTTPDLSAKMRGLGRAIFCHTIQQVLDADFGTVVLALTGAQRRLAAFGGEREAARREYALYELNA